ncbi:MAG TPA: WXG100 family type VII secretion target [Candidatus Dormibacteraeota bacterium]|nr:WXG100 family type VII secretion target [Candidatus Dormibacteraeota bacterium]
MGVLKVQFSSMSQAVDTFNQCLKQLNAHSADLDAHVQQLLQTWSGEAQAAYHSQQKRLRSAIDQSIEQLGKLSTKLDTTKQTYQATEQTIRKAWS